MTGIAIRDAALNDVSLIVEMIYAMLRDMELHGGDAISTAASAPNELSGRIIEDLKQKSTKYLIAETDKGEPIGLACARTTQMDLVFEPRNAVHLSAVYVLPEWTDRGVGSKLVSEIVDWARACGAEFCSLNVLTKSPARSMYVRHGFDEIRMSMRKLL